jgi:integrase/recombinase XerD
MMSVKAGTLKLKKDSAMGVLYLVSSSAPRLPKDHPYRPCQAYLESLAPGGVRSQRVNLERAARILQDDTRASIMDFDWRTFTSDDVEAVKNRLRLLGFSSSTINGTLSGMKGVARRAFRLKQMSEKELVLIREVTGVPAGHRVRRARALLVEEIRLLFETCEAAGSVAGARDACLLSLLYGGGLRAREACRLEMADYSARAHTLRVHGKGERDRTIYFRAGGARRAINLWLRVRGTQPGPFLRPVTRFQQVVERCLSYSAIREALVRRALASSLSHFTAHDLRRSIGTHLQEETGDIDLVRDFLGHVDVRTTQIYIMRGDATRRRASEYVNVPFRPGAGIRKKKRRRRRRRG